MKEFFLVIALLFTYDCAYSDVYKWVDKNGKLHFSDKVPEGESAKSVELKVNTYSRDESGRGSEGSNDRVVMYSTEWCGYCKKARKYFKAQNIPFVEYDIEKSRRAKREYDRLGGKGIPLIFVGKQRLSGFSSGAFERLMNKRPKKQS